MKASEFLQVCVRVLHWSLTVGDVPMLSLDQMLLSEILKIRPGCRQLQYIFISILIFIYILIHFPSTIEHHDVRTCFFWSHKIRSTSVIYFKKLNLKKNISNTFWLKILQNSA